MSVYIEFVIVDNLAIDCLIVYLALTTVKIKPKWYLVLLSGVLGTLTAIFMPYAAALPAAVPAVLKIAASCAMVAVCAKFVNFKKYLLTLGLFYLYTFLIGGICMGLMYLLGADTVSFVTLTYSYKVPVGLIVGGAFLGYLAVKLGTEYIKKRKSVESFLMETELFYRGRSVRATGFLDTGNRLFDDDTGYPVVIVHRRTVNELLGLAPGITEYHNLPKMHYTMYHTVAKCNNKILLFKPDKLLLYYGTSVHTIEEVMMGISDNDVSFGGDYSVLLHGSLVK